MFFTSNGGNWGPFWSYQLDNSANLAHLPQKWAKWAELAGFENGMKMTPIFTIFFNSKMLI